MLTWKQQKRIEETQLSPKNIEKFDKVFMCFGSVMNAFSQSGINPHSDSQKAVVTWGWDWCKTVVDKLVEEIYIKDDHEKAAQIDKDDVTGQIA